MNVEVQNLVSLLKEENRYLKEKLSSLQNEKSDIYSLAFQMNPMSINVSRLHDGLFILINDAFETYTGYTREEVIGKTSREINIWNSVEDRMIYTEQLMRDGLVDNFETQVRFKDGSVRLVSLTAKIFKFHGEDCILTIGRDIQEQRITELAYQKNKDHYKALFVDSNCVMLLVDPTSGAIVNANNAACNYYGYSHSEITAMKISDINIAPEQEIKKKMKLAINAKKNHFIFEHRLSNNEIRNAEIYTGKILFDGRELLYSVIHDITDRVKAEENLKNREAILQTVIRNVPFDMWARDLNEVCFLENETSIKTWGSLIGRSIDEMNLPEETKTIWKSNNAKVYKGKTINEEIKCINSSGKTEYFQNIVTPIFDDKNIIGILGINLDISKIKRSEEKLLQALANMEAMINNTDDSIIIADREGKSILFNRKYFEIVKKIIGTEIKPGKRFYEYLKDEQQVEFWKNLHKRVLSGEKFIEEFILEIEGVKHCFESRFYPVKENNEVIGFAEQTRDITNRKEYEKKMRKALKRAEESDKLKSAFLSNMSHEIRTPMNGIVGFAEMLKDTDLDKDKKDFYAEAITLSSKHLLKIVNDILDISKIETGQVEVVAEPTSVNELIRSLYQHFKSIAEKQNLNLQPVLNLTDKMSVFKLDKFKLNQVLENLISNSLKYTKTGYIRFGYDLERDRIKFFVEDTGIGIEPKYHEKIFQRFFREESQISYHYRGTGLGLTISKSFVEAMGGTIHLDSSPGKGSTFYFTLPMDPVPDIDLEGSIQTYEDEKIVDRPVTILIAEDEEMNFLYMKTVLSDKNITILHATDGQKAIEICRSHPEIDLILMDIKMPVINGFEATRKIREFRPELPIIAQTAYVLSEDRQKAFQSGCNDYLVKPVNFLTLKERIRRLL